MHRRGKTLLCASTAAGMLIGFPALHAEEAEDSSAAFEANKENLAATLGVPDAAATVKTHDNGMKSAVAGLSAMKMLVVRQNEDGTFTYGHAASEDDAEAFVESTHSHGPAEE